MPFTPKRKKRKPKFHNSKRLLPRSYKKGQKNCTTTTNNNFLYIFKIVFFPKKKIAFVGFLYTKRRNSLPERCLGCSLLCFASGVTLLLFFDDMKKMFIALKKLFFSLIITNIFLIILISSFSGFA